MKIPKPNYTQLPNIILDNLPLFSDAELRFVFCVCRQTFGWQRNSAKLSTSFIAKATGMSEQGVMNAGKSLREKSIVNRTQDGQSFSYSLNLEPLNSVWGSEDQPLNGVGGLPLNGVEGLKNGHKQTESIENQLVSHENRGVQPLNGVGGKKETLKKVIKKGEATAPLPFFKNVKSETLIPVQKASLYRLFTDTWCKKYQLRFGRKYMFTPGDAKAVSELLKASTPDELIELVEKAWEQTDRKNRWNCVEQSASISSFLAAYSKIVKELSEEPRKEWKVCF